MVSTGVFSKTGVCIKREGFEDLVVLLESGFSQREQPCVVSVAANPEQPKQHEPLSWEQFVKSAPPLQRESESRRGPFTCSLRTYLMAHYFCFSFAKKNLILLVMVIG